jgi:hypothetical protein
MAAASPAADTQLMLPAKPLSRTAGEGGERSEPGEGVGRLKDPHPPSASRWAPPSPAVRERGFQLCARPGGFQPSQLHTARPITSSRSRPLSHGISSVNIVTHWR